MDPSFPSQREHQLLCDLAEAIDRGDQEMFADKLVRTSNFPCENRLGIDALKFQYDSLSKLGKWETTILLRVKEQITEKEEDFS